MSSNYGLEIGDLDMIDEAFFGPPPRFLVEDHAKSRRSDADSGGDERCGVCPGLGKIKRLVGAW